MDIGQRSPKSESLYLLNDHFAGRVLETERFKYVHHAYGRVITKTESKDGTTASFQYDIEGNLVAVTDANGNTQSFEYGAFDRVKKVTDPLGATTHYHYNNEGEFAGVTNSQSHQWLYEFDTLGQVASELPLPARKPHAPISGNNSN